MKVLYFITRSDTIGGAQIHVRDLALSMIEAGHQVMVVVGGTGIYYDILKKNNIPIIPIMNLKREIDFFSDFKTIISFYNILKSFKPDIISLHSVKSGLIGRVSSFLYRKSKTIYTAHGWAHIRTALGRKKQFYIFIERWLQAVSDKVVTVCDVDRDYAIEVIKIPSNKLKTIHNGMHDLLSKKNEINQTTKFITVARFQEPKDYITLIKAFELLPTTSWQLDIVGDGPDFNEINSIVQKSKIKNSVKFLGRSDNISKLLENSNVFILISNSEGFPRSILEAMRASLPIIATDVGGVCESVKNNENGFVIPVKSPEILSSKIKSFIDSPALIDEFSKNSRLHYEAKFTFDKLYKSTTELYVEVLN